MFFSQARQGIRHGLQRFDDELEGLARQRIADGRRDWHGKPRILCTALRQREVHHRQYPVEFPQRREGLDLPHKAEKPLGLPLLCVQQLYRCRLPGLSVDRRPNSRIAAFP
jgi:hypothetical protein